MRHIRKKGFIAVTAIMVLIAGVLSYSYVVVQSALIYSDMVTRHEWRIQAGLNAQACLSNLFVMMNKDYFLEGDVLVKEFGCTAHIFRDHVRGSASVYVQTVFSGVYSTNLNQNFIVP
ncbi:MAG: hypothetical protein PHG25_03560 [Candidatus Pacebacteria bacterium]|nr:hypothetical protein [Candidatus Paceibacterota bacterium]